MTSFEDAWARIQPVLREVTSADLPWEARRAQFLELLGLSDPSHDQAVAPLFKELDEMAESDRDTLVTGDRLESWVYERLRSNLPVVTQEATQDAQTADGYDERAWQYYLTTSGTQWDGTDAAWSTFREWFVFYAQERGLGTPANALLSYLDSMSSADKISALARYGVAIKQAPQPAPADNGFGWVTAEQRTVLESRFGTDWTGPLAADLSARWGAGWEQNPPEHKAAWLAQLVASGAYATPGKAGAEADDAYLAQLAAAIREVPGYDQLSQEQLAAAIDAGLQ